MFIKVILTYRATGIQSIFALSRVSDRFFVAIELWLSDRPEVEGSEPFGCQIFAQLLNSINGVSQRTTLTHVTANQSGL